MPVQLHAHAAHQRIARQAVELRAHVVDAEVGVGDDRVRPAGLVGRPLHPGRLVLVSARAPSWSARRPIDDAGAGEVGAELLDRIVAADRLVGTEDARLHRPARATADRPAARCDDARRRPESRRSPARERQDMIDDRRASSRHRPCRRRSGETAISASVRGRKSRPAASGVSQLSRQARRESFATASASAVGSPRSRPSETMSDKRAARIGREARHGEKSLQRVADARAAVQVADDLRRAGERLLAPLEPHRARDAGQPGAEGERPRPAGSPGPAHGRDAGCPRCAPSSSRRRR